MAKFNRSNFYDKKTVSDNIERDLVLNHFDLFKIKRPTRYATLSRSFIARPDLMSLSLYGTMDYWWIIAKVNKIDDWWNDVEIGDTIQVPDINDIEDFYLNVKAVIPN